MFAAVAIVASCDKYDDSAIKESLAKLEERVAALESLREDVAALKSIVNGLVTVVSCEQKDGAYTIVLSDGKTIVVPAPYEPEEITIPVVTIVENKYWGYYLNGEVHTLMNDGKPVAVSNEAVTPQFRVDDDDCLAVSIDNGKTWTKTDAKISGGLFSGLVKEEDYIVLTLADGLSEVRVPIYKDKPLQFVAFSGKKYFAAGETKSVTIGMVGVDTYTVTEKPEGWKAVLSHGKLQVTAPAEGVGESYGCIKMLGIGKEPKIAELNVTIGTAPAEISISSDMVVTITPSSGTCFYGASLLSEFDPKSLVKELSSVTNPMLSRYPSISSVFTSPLSEMLVEVVEGETYVVWALPAGVEGVTASDVLFEAVSSVGVTYDVSDITFENAKITASVKGADKYYLVPLMSEMTVADCVTDLNGTYAYTYDRYLHDSSFIGLLAELVENPVAGEEYGFAIIPVQYGNLCVDDAVEFRVTLANYTTGGNSSVSLEEIEKEYKSITFKVSAENAYKCFTAAISESEYVSNGYADDAKLLAYLSTLTGTVYTNEYEYQAKNLESETSYYVVAVAIDRNGTLGKVTRKATATRKVEYSNIVVSVGEISGTYTSATVPLSADGEIVKYRYLFLAGTGSDYWYYQFVDDDQAVENALIYGTVEYGEATAAEAASGIVFKDLTYGVNYIFRVIGYDKEGKVTHVAKADVSPTVGAVIKFSDERWAAAKPSVTATKVGTTMQLTISFPKECLQYVVTKVSSEEYNASVPTAARLKADYILSHGYAITLTEDVVKFVPEDWYIGFDKPYILITWMDANGWYEPLVIDSATGEMLNK